MYYAYVCMYIYIIYIFLGGGIIYIYWPLGRLDGSWKYLVLVQLYPGMHTRFFPGLFLVNYLLPSQSGPNKVCWTR